MSAPVTVLVPETQQTLIAGAQANTLAGTVGGVQTADLSFFDIRDVTIETGTAQDTITIDPDGLTAYGLLNLTVSTGGNNDTLVNHSENLKPPLSGELEPFGGFSNSGGGDDIPPDAGYNLLEGEFIYDGGAGTNTLTADADVNWLLEADSLVAQGGRMLLSNVQEAQLLGGPGANIMAVEFVPTGSTRYNYGALNYFQRPDERYTLGALGHYEINEHVEAYTQLMYINDRTVSQIAETGTFFEINRIGCDNPFLSDQQFEAICGSYGLGPEDEQVAYIGRRNVEGGPRRDDLQHITYRGVFGLRGDINDVWRYDFYGQYAEVQMQQTYNNDMLISLMDRALQARLHLPHRFVLP